MVTADLEKRIQQLDPKYIKELLNFLDYLLYIQKTEPEGKRTVSKEITADTAVEPVETEGEDVPERLRIARQYFDTAPKPHFPVSKYDVYEQ